VRTRLLASVVALAAACSEAQYSKPPPMDQFTWPIGLATYGLASGGTGLLVVSSNADLLYDTTSGGTVISLDPSVSPLPWLGAIRIPSFGGTIGVADEQTCPGIGAAAGSSLALVASRYDGTLVTAALGPDGSLTCPAGCQVTLSSQYRNPYGIGIVCRGDRRRAYVGDLGLALNGNAYLGLITEVDLNTGARVPIGGLPGAPYAFAYEAERDRLWVTESSLIAAPLQAIDLSVPCVNGPSDCVYGRETVDLWPLLRGAEPRGIALSNPIPGEPRRAYIAVRVFDADLAAAAGGRPAYDTGAALLVVELSDGPLGQVPSPPPLVRMVPIGLGASEVRVLSPRIGPSGPMHDLVAVTSTTEGLLTLYDDEAGAVAKVFALAETSGPPENPASVPIGSPLLGKLPFGLAWVPDGTLDRLYVGAFESGTVTAISVDPLHPSDATILWSEPGVQP
jgi:hypothetical protein